MIRFRIYTITCLLAITLINCTFKSKPHESPKEYDLANPEKFLMPETLTEISGICFYKGKADTVYGIQDEEGKLFRLAWGVKKQYHTKFGKKGDYEDLTISHNTVVVLKSNGNLYAFPFADRQFEEIEDVKEWKHLLPEGEYEGMYSDEKSDSLFVICKNCADDNNKDKVSGYILRWGDSVYAAGSFSVDVQEIKSLLGEKVKRGFRPSALAKNPITNEWFILSSVNKLLVVTDGKWKIKQAYQLSGKTFGQPEGIAFDNAGNLYISNEGDDLAVGNILKFIRRTK